MLSKRLFFKITFFFGVLLFLGNLVFLDWQIFQEKKISEVEKGGIPVPVRPTPISESELKESSSSGVQMTSVRKENCPESCILAIDKAVKTMPISSSANTVKTTESSMKIFYLPLGSGSTTSMDWVDVPGLSSYVDPANYGKVKSIIFEASLRIPTANGRIYARLYNKNDGRPVWFSEISSEGSTSTLIQSQPISFEAGNKLYQVQAKTTMGFDSFVDFARVKFTTE